MRNHRGHLPTLRFLLIGREVLGVGVDAVSLDGLDLLDGHDAREGRVFALVFVVAAAIWMTMEVHAGCEQDLVPVTSRFVAQHIAELTVELRIERRRACRCRWQT